MIRKLFTDLLSYDDSFISVLDAPEDLTVPLLTRYLIHSTEIRDVLDCTVALNTILGKGPTGFLQKMLLGVQDGSPSTLLSSLAKLLLRQPATLQLAVEYLVLGVSMLPRSCGGRLEMEFLHILLRSTALLSYLCHAVERSDEADTTLCRGFDTDMLVVPALQFIQQCLLQAEKESPQESIVFVKGLLQAGVFVALETVLLRKSDKIAEMPRKWSSLDVPPFLRPVVELNRD